MHEYVERLTLTSDLLYLYPTEEINVVQQKHFDLTAVLISLHHGEVQSRIML